MVDIDPVDVEDDRHKDINDDQRKLNGADDYEAYLLYFGDLLVDMLDDHVDQESSEQDVIQEQVTVAEQKHEMIELLSCSNPSIQFRSNAVNQAVCDRCDYHAEQDPALVFTSGQVPASCDQQGQKNSNTDKIGNDDRIDVNNGYHKVIILSLF